MDKKTEALKLALEALEYIHEGANNQGPHTGISWRCVSNKAEPAITAIREALAEQPAQHQEPVAWLHTKIEGVAVPHRPADLDKHPDRWTALYPEPKPCPTCEALARTVMMDQTAHERKPLSDEEIKRMAAKWFLSMYWPLCNTFARAIEAAHGIKGDA